MLTLDYIKDNTLWVAHFETGYRVTGTYDEVKKYSSHDDIDEISIITWKGQPKELQEFYRDHEYAFYELNRHDLIEPEDFYNEWIKDPDQFKPNHCPVIGKLSEFIDDLKPTDDLLIKNYAYDTAGNHRVGNFKEALQILDVDFGVISFEETKSYDPNRRQFEIIVQTDDLELFKQFDIKANNIAISHDPYLGDGKYDID